MSTGKTVWGNRKKNGTFFLKGKLVQPCNWYLVDANNKVVGRLASKISLILQGKHKPEYTPHLLCGDKVVVINAKNIIFTGKKMEKKTYMFYSGYPGGEKLIPAKRMSPQRILYLAVKRMLPDNKLRKRMLRNLYIYNDEKHPHTGAKFQELKV